MKEITPKYILVENNIRQGIKDKRISGKLPGERILAKELGYSYMTIRRAIDNLVREGLLYKIPTKGTFVAERTTSRKKNKTIGYFLDSQIHSGISSPYYSMIFSAIEKHAAKNGYSVVYFSETNDQILNETLPKLDGVIATCFPRIEDNIQLIKQQLPVVVIDNSAADKSIPSVLIDNFNAEIESLDYICSLGHKRIGFITGLEDSEIGHRRLAGYKSGMKKNNLKWSEELIYHGNYSFGSGVHGAQYFFNLKQPPSAIICANDSMALGAMNQLQQYGLRIPDDVSIIGFDDINVSSQITPALTTVAAPIEKIVQNAFELLQSLMKGDQTRHDHIALSAQLIIRDTCTSYKKLPKTA